MRHGRPCMAKELPHIRIRHCVYLHEHAYTLVFLVEGCQLSSKSCEAPAYVIAVRCCEWGWRLPGLAITTSQGDRRDSIGYHPKQFIDVFSDAEVPSTSRDGLGDDSESCEMAVLELLKIWHGRNSWIRKQRVCRRLQPMIA